MIDPLRVPEAVREAVRSVLLKWLPGPFSHDLLDAFADPVLTAALKAEWVGPWGAAWYHGSGDGREYPYVYYRSEGARTMRWRMDKWSQAVSLAAALNITQGGERV